MKHVSEKSWIGSMAPKIYKFGMSVSDSITIARSAYYMYADETRSYHGVYHPIHVLEYAKDNNIKLNIEQEIAIVFHDVIYKIGCRDNEKASALFTEAVLLPHVKNEDQRISLTKITNHIIDTSQHFNAVSKLLEPTSDLVLDLDICNMTLSFSEFIKWNEAIEDELGDIPKEKRIEFLKAFVSKKKILFSETFQEKEQTVRDNLTKLISFMEDNKNSIDID